MKSHKTQFFKILISVKTPKYHSAFICLFNAIWRSFIRKIVLYYKQLISFKVHSHSRIRQTITDLLICISPALWWCPRKRSGDSPTWRTIDIHSYSDTQREHMRTQTHTHTLPVVTFQGSKVTHRKAKIADNSLHEERHF